MALDVRFGNVSKKNNSTYTGTFTASLSCILKESCSILNPSLFVEIGNPSSYNYCYISNFNRFYYVNNWTWERGRWLAECSVDVMATYKSQIGASSQYILRASNDSDGTILDTMYPTKNVISERSGYGSNPFQTGYYVIGMISPYSVNGAVTYYAFTLGEFSNYCHYLFSTGQDSIYNLTDIAQDISIEMWKSLYNPSQYIVSCMYIPMDISNLLNPISSIPYGYWRIPVSGSIVVASIADTSSFNIPWEGQHPNDTRGDYVYCSPYTQVDFSFQPFGFVQLPSDIVYKQGGVYAELSVDVMTGEGILFLGGSTFPYAVLKAQVGVPIRIAQMSTDILGAATTAVSGVANTVGSVMSGDIAGAIATGASAIDSTVRAQVPKLSVVGGGGGLSALNYTPRAVFRYYSLVDEDNGRLGRPLCQHRQISSIGGYLLCENAAVDIPGTMEESERVNQIMNTGFYYE